MKSKVKQYDQKKPLGLTRGTRKPGFKSPDFDAFRRRPMAVAFICPDGEVRLLQGTCRGFGAIFGTEQPYEATIGIYTAKGDYHNIKVDLRVECAVPTFAIGEKEFCYPVVACYTMGVKVDPRTGIMIRWADSDGVQRPEGHRGIRPG